MPPVALNVERATLSKLPYPSQQGVPSMSSFAAWSPLAANFVEGVLYCFVLFAAAGLTVLVLLTTGSVAATVAVFFASLISGVLVASVAAPDAEASPDGEETHRTMGAMGFCCAFFLAPVAVLVSFYLVLAYVNQR